MRALQSLLLAGGLAASAFTASADCGERVVAALKSPSSADVAEPARAAVTALREALGTIERVEPLPHLPDGTSWKIELLKAASASTQPFNARYWHVESPGSGAATLFVGWREDGAPTRCEYTSLALHLKEPQPALAERLLAKR